jgi:hypothetical protein
MIVMEGPARRLRPVLPSASPRDGSLLQWKTIPPWLRVIRVLFFIAGAACLAALVTAFIIQFWTIASPEVPGGPFRRPETIKGVTRYLTDPLDRVYRTSNALIPIVWSVGAVLGVINVIFERRRRGRLWQAQLGAIADRMDAEDARHH